MNQHTKGFEILRRPCSKCEELFIPQTKYSRVCDDCGKKRYKRFGK
jgi:hypothetical protein